MHLNGLSCAYPTLEAAAQVNYSHNVNVIVVLGR